jgi:chemotaxis protein MotB
MITKEIETYDTGWQVTFSDMLMLLLTFFVFIISVSNFEAVKYKKFWIPGEGLKPPEQQATQSFKFELIKGIKLPRLSNEANQLLTEIESTFSESSYHGMDVYYDEHKISLMVSEQLSFDGGEFLLKKEVQPLLLKLIEPINKSKFDVNIEGHTDTLKNPKIDNMELSLNRALTVARFFIANGVATGKLSVSGYGPYRPIAKNDTVEGRMINRRVEVNIMIGSD